MLNKLKYKLKAIKKTVEVTKVSQEYRSKLFHHRELLTTLDHDIKVFLSDDYVAQVSGDLTTSMAFALPAKKEIYINKAVNQLPRGFANAIIAHEMGHIVLQHCPTANYASEVYAAEGHGFQLELEADAFAQDKGFDMVGALNHIYMNGYASKSIEKRIKALVERRINK